MKDLMKNFSILKSKQEVDLKTLCYLLYTNELLHLHNFFFVFNLLIA